MDKESNPDIDVIMNKEFIRVACAGKDHKGVKFTATDIAKGGVPYCLCGELMERVEEESNKGIGFQRFFGKVMK